MPCHVPCVHVLLVIQTVEINPNQINISLLNAVNSERIYIQSKKERKKENYLHAFHLWMPMPTKKAKKKTTTLRKMRKEKCINFKKLINKFLLSEH